jgi:hypothetical protein
VDTDTTALIGIGLGAAGILTSGVSLLYFREQAAAARRQAEEARRQSESATRLALMESNLHMYGRFRETRNRFLDHPNLEKEWRDSHPTFSATFDACGGLDEFVAVRDAMDTMQDVYFLRRGGSVTDHYWHVWTRTFFRFYSKMPTFLLVFEFAAKEGLLHPDFVGFYRPLIQGQPLKDPAPPA